MNRKRSVMILLVIALLLIGTWFIFSCQLQKNEVVPEEDVPIKESIAVKKEERNRKEDLLTDRVGQEELVDQTKADTKQESDKPAINDSSQKSEKPQTEKAGHYEERQELVKER